MRNWENTYKRRGEVQKEVVPLVKKAAKMFKKQGVSKVLDLGCGTGRHIMFLTSLGFDVYGIDISRTAIEITKKKLEKKDLKVQLKINDMDSLDFDDEFFDAIVSTYVIHHATIDKIRKTLTEISRILKPKGLFVFIVLSDQDECFGEGKEIEKNTFLRIGDPEEEDIPHHHFTERELRNELKKFKFKIIEFEHRLEFSKRRQKMTGQFEVICQKPKKGP